MRATIGVAAAGLVVALVLFTRAGDEANEPAAPESTVEATDAPGDPAEPAAAPAPAEDPRANYMAASRMSATERDDLRARIAQNPDDAELRAKLAAALFMQRDDASRAERREHILWLVENEPGHPLLGTPWGFLDGRRDGDALADAARHFAELIAAEDVDRAVLENAASFFVLGDQRDTAFTALFRLEGMDPADPTWPAKLAHTLMLDYAPEETTPENAERASEALDAYQRAIDRSTDAAKTQSLVSEAAQAAAKAERWDLAERYARSALEAEDTDGNVGHTLHGAHQALGLVLLARGDAAGAAAELLAMAGVTPSAPMRSFGPSMLLAERLLAAGQDAGVLAYLEACRAFWPKPKLDAWIASVKAGEPPDWGGNIRY